MGEHNLETVPNNHLSHRPEILSTLALSLRTPFWSVEAHLSVPYSNDDCLIPIRSTTTDDQKHGGGS